MEWILVAIAFSVMILVHEFGHFIVAIKTGVKVEVFSLGMGPKIFSVKRKDIEYRLSAIPFGGYVKMTGEDPSEPAVADKGAFLNQSVGTRFKISIAGVTLNYILGFVLLSVVFYFGFPRLTASVGGLMDGYPAQKAGLKAGDKVISVDGQAVAGWEEMTQIIRKKTQTPVKLIVERDGAKKEISLTPRVEEIKDIFGNDVRAARIGITPLGEVEYKRYGPITSVEMGIKEAFKITAMMYKGLWGMVTGKVAAKELSGPVGIIKLMSSAAKMGIMPLVHMTAIISIAVAIFNIMPLLPLDGGLIFLLAIEKVRGKPLSRKAMENAMKAGWVFIITLVLFATYNDLFK